MLMELALYILHVPSGSGSKYFFHSAARLIFCRHNLSEKLFVYKFTLISVIEMVVRIPKNGTKMPFIRFSCHRGKEKPYHFGRLVFRGGTVFADNYGNAFVNKGGFERSEERRVGKECRL